LVFCGGGNSTDDGGSDANIADTKPDKQPSTQDSGDAATCGSGLSCEVCDNGFTPSNMAPPYAFPSLCAGADIAAFITACGNDTGNQTDCDNWQNNEGNSAPTCLGCVYSNLTDAKWGVYACDTSGNCIFNAGGCVDLVTGLVSQEKQAGGSGTCGDLIDTDMSCENYACDACTVQSDFNSCVGSADANECSVYDTPVEGSTGVCALLSPDASNAAAVNGCFGNTDPDFTTMVTLMCGSPPSDGGGD
jgi:hypothetical protein